MALNQTVIFCEGASDERMISMIIRSLGHAERFFINVQQRPLAPQMLLARLSEFDKNDRKGGALGKLHRQSQQFDKAIIVFDLDFGRPIEPAPQFAKLDGIWLAAAVPTVNSWILSDPEVYSALLKTVPRLPTYDEFISGSDFWYINTQTKRALTSKRIYSIFNPARAAMLSPSLRSFIALVSSDKYDVPDLKTEPPLASVVLSRLVAESFPANAPIYRSLDGRIFSGAEMTEEIKAESVVGKKYASDLLRVSRDFLSRQAARHQSS